MLMSFFINSFYSERKILLQRVGVCVKKYFKRGERTFPTYLKEKSFGRRLSSQAKSSSEKRANALHCCLDKLPFCSITIKP